MKAIGRPSWFKLAKIATSEASHSTTNGSDSLMDCRLLSSNSDLSKTKAFNALPAKGKILASAKGLTFVAKQFIHLG